MASFRKRSGRWQARVTRLGYPDAVKTFASKSDAERWARSVERAMGTGAFLPPKPCAQATLQDLINRYRAEVVPNLRGAATEQV